MGHYRSEMGYEDEDEKREAAHQKSLVKTTEKIQAAIDERGVASVLAEMIIDGETMTSVKWRVW